MVGVGVGFVYLVDSEDHGNACGLRVVDGFDRLRHDAVVGRDDDDGDVGNLGTAGTHGGERFVARSVEERDFLTVELDAVSTDVLSDTSGFALDDVGFADVVQKRRLTVVDVAHDGDDGRTRHEVLLAVGVLLGDGLLDFDRDELDLEPEFLGDDGQRFGVEPLVDGNHQTEVHAGCDNLRGRDVHHSSQLADGDELGDLERRTLLNGTLHLLVHPLGGRFALVAAVLGTRILGTLGREPGQGVLDLLRYLLVADLGTNDGLAVLLAVTPPLARTGLVGCGFAALGAAAVGTALAARPLAAGSAGAALTATALCLGDVDFLLGKTLALVLAARNESGNVHRTEDLRPGEGHGFGTEDVVLGRFGLGLLGLGGLALFGGLLDGLFNRFRGRRFNGLGHDGFGNRLGLGLRGLGDLGRLGLGGLRLYDGLRGRLCSLGLGVEVDFTQELGLLDFVAHVDDVALDDDLFLFLLRLLAALDGNGGLLQRNPLADRIAGTRRGTVGAELLFEDRIGVGVDLRVGRTVALDALLVQEVGDGVDTHVELLGHLNEP